MTLLLIMTSVGVKAKMDAAKQNDTATRWGKISAKLRWSLESFQEADNDKLRVIDFHILRSLTEPPSIVRREQVVSICLAF
jgi:hypothetical protein